MERATILIADDDADIRAMLSDFLGSHGYRVIEAASGSAVLAACQNPEGPQPDLILMDMRMPELNGLEVLQRLRDLSSETGVVVMTAYGSSSNAIRAIQLGAYDYLTKPFDMEEVLATVRRYLEYRQLSQEVKNSRRTTTPRDPAERIVGRSPRMLEVYKIIGRVAQSDATVLITGESGTGKELVAEVIHQNSPYRNGPLVKVGCASLPETLLESELFGHEKGSFTSAYTQRKGRFELAHKGTIFLDEIGEMTLATQKKLLRVLQEKEFERVGGSTPIKVDCRVIAATNRDLAAEVARGNFREDLYYRLNVIRIHLPPLRERREDIPLLVEHFLDKHRLSPTAPPARISPEAMEQLMAHDGPGNVRELENPIARAVVLAQGGVITPEHLILMDRAVDRAARAHLDLNTFFERRLRLAEAVMEFERRLIIEALARTSYNPALAAALLGLDLATLEAKARDYGIPLDPTALGRHATVNM